MPRKAFISPQTNTLKHGEYVFAFLSNAADCRYAIAESKRHGCIDRMQLMRIIHEQNLDRVRACKPVPLP